MEKNAAYTISVSTWVLFKNLKKNITSIVELIRIKQWVKNLFIFLPAFFAGKIDLLYNRNSFLAFLSFCFASSMIYIINDLVDIKRDRLHPYKKNRPLAKKSVSITVAILILLILTTLLILIISNTDFWIPITVYMAINIAYSVKLKHFPIIEFMLVSTGFVLRLFAGAMSNNIYISQWLILTVFLLSLCLVLGKRRDDLLLNNTNEEDLRPSLKGYNLQLIDILLTIILAMTIVSYIMYTFSHEIIERLTSNVFYTSFFVILGLFRYLQIVIVENKSGSPTEIFYKDRIIQFTILFWSISFIYLIYK